MINSGLAQLLVIGLLLLLSVGATFLALGSAHLPLAGLDLCNFSWAELMELTEGENDFLALSI